MGIPNCVKQNEDDEINHKWGKTREKEGKGKNETPDWCGMLFAL